MSSFFPLHIFPAGSLDQSVITTVWVGIFVVSFFNLRFGWLLAGLVIPGYLVPLMITKPWAAGIVILEGILTYFLAWLFSERFSKASTWSCLFGRDRFTGLVLASVVVRLVCDGWLLPRIGVAINEQLGIPFDYQSNLHSFGLILTALIANQFWKPGLRRGIVPFSAVLLITYLLVRYVLMEVTNFSISNLAYMYEDLASSILASPKAYIILITTAIVASRMNLLYGWDYNGILVPGLLALQWYEPSKILTSFIEAYLILGVAHLVLRLPVFRKATIEGARKLLLFFNISFAYRMLLGYIAPLIAPELRLSDLYGLGYLLPTLMAIKMFDKGCVTRFTFAALRTSLIGVGLASLIGFTVTLLPATISKKILIENADITEQAPVRQGTLVDVVYADKVMLFQGVVPATYRTPNQNDLDQFEIACRKILSYSRNKEPAVLLEARSILAQMDYACEQLEEKYLYLHEQTAYRGWGTYVINLNTPSTLLIEVPAALDEGRVVEAGAWIYSVSQARALAMAGATRLNQTDGSSDLLRHRSSLFRVFQNVFGVEGVMQIREFPTEAPQEQAEKSADILMVNKRLPVDLSLKEIDRLVPGCEIMWQKHRDSNVLRDDIRRGYAELWLQPKTMLRMLYAPLVSKHSHDELASELTIDGYLMEWLLGDKSRIAARGTGLYKAASLEELIFFDLEVLTPLIKVASTYKQGDTWKDIGGDRLHSISTACHAMGYDLVHYKHKTTDKEYIVLIEKASSRGMRHWGTYVLRLGAASDPEYLVQIPRPLFEKNSFEYGIALFERMQARWLLIGGAHPKANPDGSADLISADNSRNLFNLVHQVVLRESPGVSMLSIQCRAFGERPGHAFPQSQIVMGFNQGLVEPGLFSPAIRKLVDTLLSDGLSIRFADGGEDVSGYDVGGLSQALHVEAAEDKDFVLLWLSPLTRQLFRQQAVNKLQERQFGSLKIPTVTGDLYDELAGIWPERQAEEPPEKMRTRVNQYMETQDIVAISGLRVLYPEYDMRRFIDRNTQQAFLLVKDPGGSLVLVANLAPLNSSRSVSVPDLFNRDALNFFIQSRSGWLDWGTAR